MPIFIWITSPTHVSFFLCATEISLPQTCNQTRLMMDSQVLVNLVYQCIFPQNILLYLEPLALWVSVCCLPFEVSKETSRDLSCPCWVCFLLLLLGDMSTSSPMLLTMFDLPHPERLVSLLIQGMISTVQNRLVHYIILNNYRVKMKQNMSEKLSLNKTV